jgi:hypothetical protein
MRVLVVFVYISKVILQKLHLPGKIHPNWHSAFANKITDYMYSKLHWITTESLTKITNPSQDWPVTTRRRSQLRHGDYTKQQQRFSSRLKIRLQRDLSILHRRVHVSTFLGAFPRLLWVTHCCIGAAHVLTASMELGLYKVFSGDAT